MIFINLFFLLLINLLIFYYNNSIANYLNLFDDPDNVRKYHKNKVPITGGIIIFSNLSFFFIFILINNYDVTIFENNFKIYFFYLACSLFFFLGIIDDKFILNANLKFILILTIISSLLFFDNSFVIDEVRFIYGTFKLNMFSIPWTLICFLLFINAFNMFDGYNLQASSYSIIFFSYLFLKSQLSVFIFVILISLIFFSVLNFKSKSFLGDGGSYLLAFILGGLSIKIYNIGNIRYVEEIVILMMIPGIDLMRLFFERIFIYKKSPFKPDRNHLHHYLIDIYGEKKTFFILNSLIIFPFLIGILISQTLLFIILQLFIYFFLVSFLKKKLASIN